MKVSAPGKVILFGDHSVVYNRKAIAAAISLRTTLTFTPGPLSAALTLDFPDINLHLTVPLDFLTRLSVKQIPEPDQQIDANLMLTIDQYLDTKGLEGVVKAAAGAFLYLYAHLGAQAGERSHGTYHLNSELPIGAGLGSSATVSVIIVTTLLLISGVIDPPHLTNEQGQGQKTLDLINKWAYTGEQCIHGTPSGVDNTVATYGAAVSFQKTAPMVSIAIPALPLLLTNTGVPRSTKTQVANVARLRDAVPAIIEPVLDSMHEIALEAERQLSRPECDRESLGRLIVLNQGLLATLGVSHPSIEAIIAANQDKGWTKLIGAGGGGCVVTLLNEQFQNVNLTAANELESYMVSLGGPGVGYHTVDDDVEFWA